MYCIIDSIVNLLCADLSSLGIGEMRRPARGPVEPVKVSFLLCALTEKCSCACPASLPRLLLALLSPCCTPLPTKFKTTSLGRWNARLVYQDSKSPIHDVLRCGLPRSTACFLALRALSIATLIEDFSCQRRADGLGQTRH